ncbi:MAG: peroxiredoxin [Thermoanaerobaculaceae bacterium]
MGRQFLILTLLFVFGAGLTAAQDLLKVGDVFPAFSLPDESGKEFSSALLQGKPFLIWFYPKAMTPGCTKEGCELRDNFAAFKQAGVEIVGVSFDAPAANKKFKEKHAFAFPLLSDEARQLAVKVGAADDPKAWFPKRISYLVGADGRVLKVYPKVSPSEHAKEVLNDWRKLGLGPGR